MKWLYTNGSIEDMLSTYAAVTPQHDVPQDVTLVSLDAAGATVSGLPEGVTADWFAYSQFIAGPYHAVIVKSAVVADGQATLSFNEAARHFAELELSAGDTVQLHRGELHLFTIWLGDGPTADKRMVVWGEDFEGSPFGARDRATVQRVVEKPSGFVQIERGFRVPTDVSDASLAPLWTQEYKVFIRTIEQVRALLRHATPSLIHPVKLPGVRPSAWAEVGTVQAADGTATQTRIWTHAAQVQWTAEVLP